MELRCRGLDEPVRSAGVKGFAAGWISVLLIPGIAACGGGDGPDGASVVSSSGDKIEMWPVEADAGAPMPTAFDTTGGDGAEAAGGGVAGPGAGLPPSGGSRAGGSSDGSDEPELTWDDLYELDPDSGDAPEMLRALDGRKVRIPGFMVPLEDSAEQASEFLLVPYAGACIHVPPPPPNQIVHVLMDGGRSSNVYWWDPIWVVGTLHIDEVEHAYGRASYRMTGLETEVYTFEEPNL